MPTVNLNRRVRGRDLEEFLALIDGVQDTVAITAADIAVDADALLLDHHVDHIAHIDVTRGDIDRYVCLVDSNVTNAESMNNNSALSIEMGRAGYIDPTTGESWGEMDGLYVLSRAAGVKRRRGRIAKRVRKKPKRGAGGRFIVD